MPATKEGSIMKPFRGITVASITMKKFNEMENTLPYADSPFDLDNILIDGGSWHHQAPGHACMVVGAMVCRWRWCDNACILADSFLDA